MEENSEKMLLEILRMARELVISEHTDRRAQLHNAWLYDSEQLWKTRRMKLKYPDIPPYPTEQDVLERAQTLLKFLVLGNTVKSPDQDIELPISLPQEILEAPQQEPEQQIIESPVDEPIPVESSGRILPTVLKQLEKMRNKF